MKTMKERLDDNEDSSMPRVNRDTCSYCHTESLGVNVQDFNRQLQHACFSCINELESLFK